MQGRASSAILAAKWRSRRLQWSPSSMGYCHPATLDGLVLSWGGGAPVLKLAKMIARW
jgi:hypothetical protein